MYNILTVPDVVAADEYWIPEKEKVKQSEMDRKNIITRLKELEHFLFKLYFIKIPSY